MPRLLMSEHAEFYAQAYSEACCPRSHLTKGATHFFPIYMARPEGFEPPTTWFSRGLSSRATGAWSYYNSQMNYQFFQGLQARLLDTDQFKWKVTRSQRPSKWRSALRLALSR